VIDKKETEQDEKEIPVVSTQVKTSGLLGGLLNGLGNLEGVLGQALENAGQPVVTQGGFTGSVAQWAEKRGHGAPKEDTWGVKSYPAKPKPAARERPLPAPVLDMFDEEHEIVITGTCPGYSEEDFTYSVKDGKLAVAAADYSEEFVLPEGVDAEQIVLEVKNGLFLCRIPRRKDEEE